MIGNFFPTLGELNGQFRKAGVRRVVCSTLMKQPARIIQASRIKYSAFRCFIFSIIKTVFHSKDSQNQRLMNRQRLGISHSRRS